MKKLILIIATVAFSHSITFSQGCLPEGITFNYQWQIDNFQTNYPGCTEIEGNVTIFDNYSGNINNLNGLNALTSIGGQLVIYDNSALNSLTGLDNLTSIGGSLAVNGNNLLTSLTGLENVTSVGGGLTIGGGNSLTSLAGLNNLSFVGGTLRIIGTNALINMTGLESLTSIGGDLMIGDNYSGSGNSILTNFAGLDNLTSIGGDIYIRYNDVLTSLTGLDNIDAGSINNLSVYSNISLSDCDVLSLCNYLASPNGTVVIYGNDTGCANPGDIANSCGFPMPCLPLGNYYFVTQADVDGFPANYPGCTQLEGEEVKIYGNGISNLDSLSVITEIAGTLHVFGNNVISDLTGLENLVSIGGWLQIHDVNNLTNLMGLNNLTTIGAQFAIYQNNNMVSLSGMDNLTSIGGWLQIHNNDALTNLGLESLMSAGGLSIDDNDALTNLGLESLMSAGGLSIDDNDALTNLAGLDNLDSLGYLSITGNNALTNFTGLESLSSIGGSLEIYGNNSLINLSGLEGLTSISGSLLIGKLFDYPPYGIGNPSLESIESLINVVLIGGDLTIRNNQMLSNCAIESICDYLAIPNGNITIFGNAPGCNSQAEVEAACLTPIESIFSNKEISIYPNPGKDFLIVSTHNGVNWDDVVIYNLAGQKVLQSKTVNNTLDISKFRPGMYIVEMVTKQGKVREKLMVE
jgi:hypothetical protein